MKYSLNIFNMQISNTAFVLYAIFASLRELVIVSLQRTCRFVSDDMCACLITYKSRFNSSAPANIKKKRIVLLQNVGTKLIFTQ